MDPVLMAALTDPLAYAFIRNGLLEVLVLGAACGLVGPFVVQRNLTFFGHSLSHTILPTLVMAAVLGLSPFGAAVVGALLTVALVYYLQRRRNVGDDTAVGVVFVGMFALGIVLVGWFRVKSPDVGAAMVGNLLGIGWIDLTLSAALLLVLALLTSLVYRPLVLVSFDRVAAEALGLPIVLLDVFLLGAIGGVAVVGVKVVGVILTVAVLVTPAAAARQWTVNLPRNMVLSAVFVSLSGAAGLYAGYYVRVAPAAIIVLLLSGVFCVSMAFGRHRAWTAVDPRVAGPNVSGATCGAPRDRISSLQ